MGWMFLASLGCARGTDRSDSTNADTARAETVASDSVGICGGTPRLDLLVPKGADGRYDIPFVPGSFGANWLEPTSLPAILVDPPATFLGSEGFFANFQGSFWSIPAPETVGPCAIALTVLWNDGPYEQGAPFDLDVQLFSPDDNPREEGLFFVFPARAWLPGWTENP